MTDFSVQHWIDGAPVEPGGARRFPVWNPSTGDLIAQTREASEADVALAAAAAARAFPAWSETPPSDRARVLFRYREVLERDFEALARLITIENGKTIEEARGSLRRGIEVVEFACGAPSLLMGIALRNVARGIDGRTEREPLGVCLGISPFNFPAMVPMWMYPIAIACGNTFILKPSERVPLSAMRQAALLTEAGLPPGVFNVVHGGPEVSGALIDHPDVAAVSFVGSTQIARR